MIHYTHPYLLSPTHPVTINVIGAGGNGSQMLNCLARIHTALIRLGHPGFMVTTWDPDMVTDANLGRQLFAQGDIGVHKAIVLTTRINRFYGVRWNAEPRKYHLADLHNHNARTSNITITCTDNIESREYVNKNVIRPKERDGSAWAYNVPYYWLDLGNTKTTGQCILGTAIHITNKNKDHTQWLPNVIELFPQEKKRGRKKQDDGPSCSLAEALEKQDLFINSTLVQLGANLIWKMFRKGKIDYHGVFLNLDTMQTTPLKVK